MLAIDMTNTLTVGLGLGQTVELWFRRRAIGASS